MERLLKTHVLFHPANNRKKNQTPKALRNVMLFHYGGFITNPQGLSSRNNDILKKNDDILAVGIAEGC
jgi:hypothetical protein